MGLASVFDMISQGPQVEKMVMVKPHLLRNFMGLKPVMGCGSGKKHIVLKGELFSVFQMSPSLRSAAYVETVA